MDGENNGSKPYEQMDDLGVFPLFLETAILQDLNTLTFKKLPSLKLPNRLWKTGHLRRETRKYSNVFHFQGRIC